MSGGEASWSIASATLEEVRALFLDAADGAI